MAKKLKPEEILAKLRAFEARLTRGEMACSLMSPN